MTNIRLKLGLFVFALFLFVPVFVFAGSITTGVVNQQGGSAVNVEGNNCTTTECVFNFSDSERVDLVAFPAPGFVFNRWTGPDAGECASITNPTCGNILLNLNKNIKGFFDLATCPGPGCPACNDGIDNDGEEGIDLADPDCTSATDNSEHGLHQCNDCIDNDGDGDADLEDSACVGVFDDNEEETVLQLGIVQNGGNGRIYSSDSRIDCEPSCTITFTGDELVTLTQSVFDTSSKFVQWLGDCTGGSGCQISMDQDRNVQAEFAAASGPSLLNITVIGDGVVNYTFGSVNRRCPSECNATYFSPEFVTLTADPDPGESFITWIGDCTGTSPSCVINMDQNRNVTAQFSTTTPYSCPNNPPPGGCPECSDGINNDPGEDSNIDYPADAQCDDANDDQEADDNNGGLVCPRDGQLCPDCNDGIDNDGDGTADYISQVRDSEGNLLPPDLVCQGEADKNTEVADIDIIEI